MIAMIVYFIQVYNTDLYLDRELDALFLTETWLSESDDVPITELTPEGFHFIHAPRKSRRGGGVGIVYKSDIKVQQNEWSFASCEGLDMHIRIENKPVRVLLVYRPPQCNKSDFLTELSDFLSEAIASKHELLILGDLNFHLEDDDCPQTRELRNLIAAFSLTSRICEPTHKAGHTLDAVLHIKNSAFVINHTITDLDISDHFLIELCINSPKPIVPRKSITKRNIKDIDLEQFRADISSLSISHDVDIASAVESYNTTLKKVIDDHAPLQTKQVKIRRNTRWFNEQIRSAKVVRRRLERKMKKSGLVSDKQTFLNQCRYVNFLVKSAKRNI